MKKSKKQKRMTLRQYYKTEHWNELRKKYSYSDEAECEICHGKRFGFYKIGPKKGQRKPKSVNQLHLHHKHYRNMLNEGREDLMLLCDSCHKFGHMLEKIKSKHPMYKKMYDDFKKETGWEFKKR